MKYAHKNGFTLIEVVVTVVIGTLLIGVSLPAMQRGRAKSQRAMCTNNLKMIGLSMHNYHDAYNLFPPGWIGAKKLEVKQEQGKNISNFALDGVGGGAKPTVKNKPSYVPQVNGENHTTWQYFILPLLEEGALYDEMRNHLDQESFPNYTNYLSKPLKVYMCPDDDSPETFEVKNNKGVSFKLARSNYAGNFGGKYEAGHKRANLVANTLADCEPDIFSGKKCMGSGIFDHNGNLKMHSITDGTSNTFMIAERTSFKVKTKDNKESDYNLFWGVYLPDSNMAANRFLMEFVEKPNLGTGYSRWGSPHTGGAFVCFCDGSVHFITEKVDEAVIQKLGTKDGYEVVNYEDYTKE